MIVLQGNNTIDDPIVIKHFVGADVKLNPMNTFIRITQEVQCLAFVPSNISILGNLAQMNFLIVCDLKNKTVSFKPTDCTQHSI